MLFLLGWFSAVPPSRGLRDGATLVVVAGSRGDGVASAPCMSCPKVTWLQSLGGEVATCGLHPVEETGKEGPGMVIVMGLKLQRMVQHGGVAGEGM